jgi:lantibiotic modifying enzyme
MMQPWQPILVGEEAKQAGRLARAIADAIRTRAPVLEPGVAQGAAGNALLFAQLHRTFPRHGYDEASERELSRAIEAIGSRRLDPSLYAGFSGVGWAVLSLDPRAAERIDFEDLDAAVRMAVHPRRRAASFDLVNGLAGLGVYLLARLPDPSARLVLESLIAELGSRSQLTSVGNRWLSLPEGGSPAFATDCPDGWYDLGMAHGVAGVIAFLAAARVALADSPAGELVDGAVRWLLSVRQDRSSGSLFPYVVGVRERQASRKSRVAWCYGDLGIAWALWASVRHRGDMLARDALDMARLAMARPLEDTGVMDAGICHGASGLAHLLMRLGQESEATDLLVAARFWCRKAMQMAGDPEDLAAFVCEINGRRERDTSLLTGAGGVALVLLAASSEFPPDWDGFLGLSLKQRFS